MYRINTRVSVLPAVVAALALGGLQPHASAQELPATDGAFYAISVRDLESATAWYTEHLDFELTSRGGNDQRQGALLERPGALLELAEFNGSMARGEIRPGLESHQVQGIFKLGFTTAHLEDTYALLEKAGVEIFFPIVEASGGSRTFGVKDPEGNIIQFLGE